MAVVEDREPWLAHRKKGICATDIAALHGLSPWATPLDVYLNKTERTPEPPSSRIQRRGIRMESVIAEEFCEVTNTTDLLRGADIAKIFPGRVATWDGEHAIIEHKKFDYLIGTPDGISPLNRRGLEVKNVGHKGDDWGYQGSGDIPPHYLMQCMWYMAITEFEAWDVAALFGGTNLEVFTLHRDLGLEKTIIDTGRQFWNDHVLKRVPPPIDWTESWSRYLGRMFAIERRPAALPADSEMTHWLTILRKANEILEQAEKDQREAKNNLMNLIGDAKGAYADFGRVTWIRKRPSIITDWQKVAAELSKQFKPEFVASLVASHTSERTNTPYLMAKFKKGA